MSFPTVTFASEPDRIYTFRASRFHLSQGHYTLEHGDIGTLQYFLENSEDNEGTPYQCTVDEWLLVRELEESGIVDFAEYFEYEVAPENILEHIHLLDSNTIYEMVGGDVHRVWAEIWKKRDPSKISLYLERLGNLSTPTTYNREMEELGSILNKEKLGKFDPVFPNSVMMTAGFPKVLPKDNYDMIVTEHNTLPKGITDKCKSLYWTLQVPWIPDEAPEELRSESCRISIKTYPSGKDKLASILPSNFRLVEESKYRVRFENM